MLQLNYHKVFKERSIHMKVITYSSMKDFIDDTLELLLKDEAVNQLLILCYH